MSEQIDPRFVVLHALAEYLDARPEGLPVRTMIGLIDAVEMLRLTSQELNDALEYLTREGLIEQSGQYVRLTEALARAVPRDGDGRVSYDRGAWPPLG